MGYGLWAIWLTCPTCELAELTNLPNCQGAKPLKNLMPKTIKNKTRQGNCPAGLNEPTR
jgi:hypothetical protein